MISNNTATKQQQIIVIARLSVPAAENDPVAYSYEIIGQINPPSTKNANEPIDLRICFNSMAVDDVNAHFVSVFGYKYFVRETLQTIYKLSN